MSIRNFYKMQLEKRMHLQRKQSQQQQQHHHDNLKTTTTRKRTRTLQGMYYGVDSSFEDAYVIKDNIVYEIRGFSTGILFLLLVREVVRRCFNGSNRD
mmetsp:Transcript_5218/g.6342  ORF Transcript_5218/g.6342 Transcript_5218/m.6342 type:complete len:98 (-) Transcript_5218:110-403(-)